MLKTFIRNAVLVVVLAVGLQPASAEVRLPHLLSDNMVLQRDRSIPVWGWANPNEKVTVKLGKP